MPDDVANIKDFPCCHHPDCAFVVLIHDMDNAFFMLVCVKQESNRVPIKRQKMNEC